MVEFFICLHYYNIMMTRAYIRAFMLAARWPCHACVRISKLWKGANDE